MSTKMRVPVYVTMAIDPAVTASERSDFTGFTIVGTAPNGDWYIIEAEQFKGRPDQVVERAVALAREYRPRVISLEAVAAQILFKPLLVPRLRDAGVNTSIHEYRLSHKRSKAQRIEALQPLFKQGKIHIREGLRDLCEQLDRYPELDHDDIIDSLAQHLELSRPAKVGEQHPVMSRDWWEDYAHLGDSSDQRRKLDGTSTGRSSSRTRRLGESNYGLQ